THRPTRRPMVRGTENWPPGGLPLSRVGRHVPACNTEAAVAGRVATKHDEGPMPSVDHINKEVLFKIVYYGPGLGGKTTNLERIYEQAAPDQCGTMLTLCSER